VTEDLAVPRAAYRACLAIAARAAIDPTGDQTLRLHARAELLALMADLKTVGQREALRLTEKLESALAAQGPLPAEAASLVSELMTTLERGAASGVMAEARRSLKS
jgi:hypothetical protein